MLRSLRITVSLVSGLCCLLVVVMCVSVWQTGTAIKIEQQTQSRGMRQLCKLLEDRPSMRRALDENCILYKWVAARFDAISGSQIDWDSAEPISGRPAEHESPTLSEPGRIRITGSDLVSGRDKWYMLVYELHNITNAELFGRLDQLALAGEISREKYSKSCLFLEFNALVRTKRFLELNPIVDATALNAPLYCAYLKGTDDFNVYVDALNALTPNEYDPRDYYGYRFDTLTHAPTRDWPEWWQNFLRK